MTESDSSEPRALMRRLWRASGLSCGQVMAAMGLDLAPRSPEYDRVRRVLAGVTMPADAQEAGAILAALGLPAMDAERQGYVLAYLRWAQAGGLGAFARLHGVRL